jgi:SH3-like domain-containing protein
MTNRQTARLGLLARLGFAGAAGILVISALASFDWRGSSSEPATVAALNEPPATRPAAADADTMIAKVDDRPIDAPSGPRTIEDLLAEEDGALPEATEATGSVTPTVDAKISVGSKTGLPIPRFVSLKRNEVNVRKGPGKDYGIAWIFKRAGLPVEVTAEFDNWRRIRDAEGSEGWVLHSLLSGERTAIVAPWSKDAATALYRSAGDQSPVVARLEAGVLAEVHECTGDWCRVDGDGFAGWIRQSAIWGAYPGERFD